MKSVYSTSTVKLQTGLNVAAECWVNLHFLGSHSVNAVIMLVITHTLDTARKRLLFIIDRKCQWASGSERSVGAGGFYMRANNDQLH